MSMAITDLASPGGDPQASQLAEALTGNLVARLGLFGGVKGRLHLVPAKSSGGEDRGNLDPRRVGSNLNVRYVLGGEVRRGSDGSTVYLQLVDAQSGKQVWAERDSLRDLDVPAPDSPTVRQLSEKIRVAVYSAETRRVVEEPLGSLSPTEIVLRAWDQAQKNETLQGTLEAQRLVDEALRRDPGLVFGLISRAALTDYENDIDPRPDHDRIVRDLDYYTGRAVSLDPTDPGAWTWRAVALIYLGRWDSALEANARAIKLDPYEPAYYVSRAWLLAVTGRPAQALELTDRALAMKPDNAAWALRVACESHLLLGHSDQAIANCVRSAGLNKNWFIHLLLAAAYANRGDAEQAAAEKAEVLRTAPGYTIAQLRAKRFSDNADYQKLAEAYWYEGLRKAGFPDR
jgi:tetratricopeptide (TPR) repeat protein